MLTVFVIEVHKRAEILERVAGLARRRGFEIQSLSLGPTDMPDLLRMTLVVETEEAGASRFLRHLGRLQNVLKVYEISPKHSLLRDLAIIKIAATAEERSEIIQIASVFGARIVDICRQSIAIECTGGSGKVDRLVELLASYGIVEMARTGLIAMRRGLNGGRREAENEDAQDNDENLRQLALATTAAES